MIPQSLSSMIRSLRGMFGKQQAGVDTDPWLWLNNLHALPDPDPILRGIGRAEQVYNSLLRDPHVIGDVRSIRGNFRSYDYRLNIGNPDDPASIKAHALCEDWMRRYNPAGTLASGLQPDWLEVMWQMTSAILTGYHPHELVWQMDGAYYLPEKVLQRPARRFRFSADGSPLLLSRDSGIAGKPVEPQYWVISRHMASASNPYGIALLSSCFWAWTFKTGGWRTFVKYCERHGLPWPVARYPMGTDEKEIDKLEEAVANMLEGGYVVAPEGTGLEILTPTSSGSASGLPQQQLIDTCNREISKALTGQAMVAELNRVGARAASETAADRQSAINDADRDIASAGMGQIFRWITLFNFGDGVAPPELEFYHHEKAGKERAEAYEVAARLGARPSKAALLEEMGIPEAENDADALQVPSSAAATAAATTGQPVVNNRPVQRPQDPAQFSAQLHDLAAFEFARAAGMTEDEAMQLATEAADQAIEDHMIAPIVSMLDRYAAEGKTLAQFSADLQDLVGQMDDSALREVLERALSYSILRGAATRVG